MNLETPSLMNANIDIAKYGGVLRGFAFTLCGNHEIAAELTQETLLKGWQHRSQLAEVKNTRAWLFRVLSNQWKDWLKSKKNLTLSLEENSLYSSEPGPLVAAELNEEFQRVLAGMQCLPTQQRQVLYLRSVEEMSLEEIANVLETNRNNVKSHLSLARKAMRKILGRTAPQGE